MKNDNKEIKKEIQKLDDAILEKVVGGIKGTPGRNPSI